MHDISADHTMRLASAYDSVMHQRRVHNTCGPQIAGACAPVHVAEVAPALHDVTSWYMVVQMAFSGCKQGVSGTRSLRIARHDHAPVANGRQRPSNTIAIKERQ